MKIGIIGSGHVAQTLATGFLKHGHEVMLGTRDTGKLATWLGEHPTAKADSVAACAHFGELLLLAVKGNAAVEALRPIDPTDLAGKTIIDTCNPIIEEPPVNGVLSFFTDLHHSLMEQLQQAYPTAHFVKAFNSVGSAVMVNPAFAEGRASMFICGNDAAAKATVSQLLDQFGWDAVDMGMVESARAIEPMCILWCLPGMLRNDWKHGFKLVH